MPDNGSRLDRIEAILEQVARQQAGFVERQAAFEQHQTAFEQQQAGFVERQAAFEQQQAGFVERQAAIAERHAALAQTVEILGGMQRENEQRFERLMDAMDRLVRIVEDHQRRLDDLEGRV